MSLLPGRRVGRRLGVGLAILAALLWLGEALDLARSGTLDLAIGCCLVAAFFLAVAALALLPASPAGRRAGVASQSPRLAPGPSTDLVELMSSTDAVAIEIVRGKLAANGIAAVIEGQHTSRMLGYLPVVPQRLMVPRSDLAFCSQILGEEDKLN